MSVYVRDGDKATAKNTHITSEPNGSPMKEKRAN